MSPSPDTGWGAAGTARGGASPPFATLPVRQPQELLARPRVVAEDAAERAGDGGRVLLLHAAHHHAEVRGLDHHAHAAWLQHLANGVGDLLREPLLHLQPPRE